MVVHKSECVSFSKGTLGLRSEPSLEWYEYFGIFNTDPHMLELSQENAGILITMCLRAFHFLLMKRMGSIRDKTKEPL